MKQLRLLAKRSGLLLAGLLVTSLAQADHKPTPLWESPLWESSVAGYLLFFVVTGVCYVAMVWEPRRERVKLPVQHHSKRK